MSIKVIHIPSAISFDVPDVYGSSEEDVENFIEWHSWCLLCRDKGIRYMIAYVDSSKEDKQRLFQYNRYEYMIVRDEYDENSD